MAHERCAIATTRTAVPINPFPPRSFHHAEAIVFFRNVDYDYRSGRGDRVRRQPYQPGFPYPFFSVLPTIIRLFFFSPYVFSRASTPRMLIDPFLDDAKAVPEIEPGTGLIFFVHR